MGGTESVHSFVTFSLWIESRDSLNSAKNAKRHRNSSLAYNLLRKNMNLSAKHR